jgi:hypothetical protein
MVKFNTLRKAISKRLAPKEDDATLIASQAAKDAQFQLQMQQYQQWQLQQQQMQMQQGVLQTMVHADPPAAAMMNADEPAAEAPETSSPVKFPEVAGNLVDSDEAQAYEDERRNEEASGGASTVDEIAENRDTYEPDEETALANFSTEEEESVASEEEEEEEATTDDDGTRNMSYDEETYDGADTEVKDAKSYDGSLAACEAMGNQKKFFHKDVVLHNLNDYSAGNDLVIRAMYFVPKPKSPEDVVVRIEVSFGIHLMFL